jgi:hypothetical protein
MHALGLGNILHEDVGPSGALSRPLEDIVPAVSA